MAVNVLKKERNKKLGEFCVVHQRAKYFYQLVTPVLLIYPSSGLGAGGQFRTRVPRHNISPHSHLNQGEIPCQLLHNIFHFYIIYVIYPFYLHIK